MNAEPANATPAEVSAVTQREAEEQRLMPYDQNFGRLRQEPKLSDAPTDENLVDDDIIEEGQHTT